METRRSFYTAANNGEGEPGNCLSFSGSRAQDLAPEGEARGLQTVEDRLSGLRQTTSKAQNSGAEASHNRKGVQTRGRATTRLAQRGHPKAAPMF